MLLATFTSACERYQLALYEVSLEYLPDYSLYLLPAGAELALDGLPEGSHLIAMFQLDMWGMVEIGDMDMDGFSLAADIGGKILAALSASNGVPSEAAYHTGQIAEQLEALEATP